MQAGQKIVVDRVDDGSHNMQFGTGNCAAVLNLFESKPIMDFVRRPLQYNFGNEFVEATAQAAAKAMNYGVPISNTQYYLRENPMAATSILPTAQGTVVETSRYSNDWTFMLTTDMYGVTGTLSRFIYTGIALNMDVSMSGYVNPDTVLKFTRVVQVDQTSSGNTVGSRDTEVVDTASQQSISRGDGTYDLNPASTIGTAFSSDPYGHTSMYSLDAARITGRPLLNHSEMNDSAAHVNMITSTMTAALSSSIRDSDNLDYGGDIVNNTLHQMHSSFQFDRNSTQTAVSNGVILDISKVYTVRELDTKYGGQLCVHLISYLSKNCVDLTLPNAPTARNVCISIISNAIHEALVRYGLSSVTFDYMSAVETNQPYGLMSQMRSPVVQVYNISTLIQMESDRQKLAWDRFYGYLEAYVFSIIKNVTGRDFRVSVNATVAGTIYINLNFLDEVFDPTFVAIEATLGGMNTSMLGSKELQRSNTGNLAGAVNDVCTALGVNKDYIV